MIFDSHSHATYSNNIFLCSENSSQWNNIIKQSINYGNIIPFIGIHPYEINNNNDYNALLKNLQKLISKTDNLQIGEIGLDFSINKETEEKQIYIFKEQLNIALKYNRIANIHVVRAWHRIVPILKEYGQYIPIIIHAYNANAKITKQLIEIPLLYFSINNKFIKDITNIKLIPKNRLLFETDYTNKDNFKDLIQSNINLAHKLNLDTDIINSNYNFLVKYTQDEIIDMYKSKNNKITIKKSIAHKLGYKHETVHIWIKNQYNEILLQKRASSKDIFPNLYDISVAGHISSNEEIFIAALREIKEEIGINIKSLIYINNIEEKKITNNLIDNEIHYIFFAKIDKSTKINIQKSEVESITWVTKKQLINLINSNKFVPHDREYMNFILAKL